MRLLPMLALVFAACAPVVAPAPAPAPEVELARNLAPARCPRLVAVVVGIAPSGARCAVAYFEDGTTQAVCREERGA